MISRFWKFVEDVLYFIISKLLGIRPSEETWANIIQFVKFGVVGLTNSAISYIVYLILIWFGMHYTPANIIGFTASVFNSYF